MSTWLIIATGLAYAAVAIEAAIKGQWPTCIVFGGYAFSNIGLYLLADKALG